MNGIELVAAVSLGATDFEQQVLSHIAGIPMGDAVAITQAAERFSRAVQQQVAQLVAENAALEGENAEMRLALSDRATESEIAAAAVRQATAPLLAMLDELDVFRRQIGRACPFCDGREVDHLPTCRLAQALSSGD
jgi:regulator of replication initiation timing